MQYGGLRGRGAERPSSLLRTSIRRACWAWGGKGVWGMWDEGGSGPGGGGWWAWMRSNRGVQAGQSSRITHPPAHGVPKRRLLVHVRGVGPAVQRSGHDAPALPPGRRRGVHDGVVHITRRDCADQRVGDAFGDGVGPEQEPLQGPCVAPPRLRACAYVYAR